MNLLSRIVLAAGVAAGGTAFAAAPVTINETDALCILDNDMVTASVAKASRHDP